MPNFLVCVITNLQSLKLVHSCIPINLLPINWELIFSCWVNFYGTSLQQCFKYRIRCIVPYYLPLQATTGKGTLNVAKVQYKLRVAYGLNLPWYGSMKWNMEENSSMEWNMEWKIFSMEWKWNGRKLPVWNIEKSSSIPFHTMLCPSYAFRPATLNLKS